MACHVIERKAIWLDNTRWTTQDDVDVVNQQFKVMQVDVAVSVSGYHHHTYRGGKYSWGGGSICLWNLTAATDAFSRYVFSTGRQRYLYFKRRMAIFILQRWVAYSVRFLLTGKAIRYIFQVEYRAVPFDCQVFGFLEAQGTLPALAGSAVPPQAHTIVHCIKHDDMYIQYVPTLRWQTCFEFS